jgi:hypothetical protein
MPPNNIFGSGSAPQQPTSRIQSFFQWLVTTKKGRIVLGAAVTALLILGASAFAYYATRSSQNATESVSQTDSSSTNESGSGVTTPDKDDEISSDETTDKDKKDTKSKDTKSKGSGGSTGTKSGSSTGGSGGDSGGGSDDDDDPTPSNCSGVANQPGGADPWGGCWPGPSNTGIAGCPALSTHNGDYNVSSGATVQNMVINGQLRVSAAGASNIVVRCVKVNDGGFFPVDTERSGATSASQVLLDRVEVDCGGSQTTHGAFLLFGATARKSRAYNCPDAFRFGGNVVIEDSYCSNLNVNGDDENEWHYDCIQTGGGENVTLRHNSLVGRDTSDIALWPEYEPLENVLVERNLLLGTPGYKIYVGRNTNPSENITIKDNRFGPGGYGPCTIENASPTWTGNVWNSTGVALPIGSC